MDENIKALLDDPNWPQCVDPDLICDETSESDKLSRAKSIVLATIKDAKNKKVLDYGCGEGHTVAVFKELGADAIGYDVVPHDGVINDWQAIVDNGPYDIIMLYDVLDHAENPVECLNLCKGVLNKNGKIYCTCHPYCSRHGGHQYKTLNKAFAHLFLNDEEKTELGIELPVKRVFYPLASYRKMIKESGLVISKEEVDRSPIESFFTKNKHVKKRIMANWGRKPDETFPQFQMEQNFLGYVLCLK